MSDSGNKPEVTEKALQTWRVKEADLGVPYAPPKYLVEALGARLRLYLQYKGAEDLTPAQLMQVAAASLSTDANPLADEIWAFTDRDNNLQLIYGISLWVKKLYEAQKAQGFTMEWTHREATAEEIARSGVEPSNVRSAWICEATRSDWDDNYRKTLDAVRPYLEFLPVEDIKAMIGERKTIIGIGIVRADERYKDSGTNMAPEERAKKRALKAVISKVVSLTANYTGEVRKSAEAWEQVTNEWMQANLPSEIDMDKETALQLMYGSEEETELVPPEKPEEVVEGEAVEASEDEPEEKETTKPKSWRDNLKLMEPPKDFADIQKRIRGVRDDKIISIPFVRKTTGEKVPETKEEWDSYVDSLPVDLTA